jgi:hypothetical protein
MVRTIPHSKLFSTPERRRTIQNSGKEAIADQAAAVQKKPVTVGAGDGHRVGGRFQRQPAAL